MTEVKSFDDLYVCEGKLAKSLLVQEVNKAVKNEIRAKCYDNLNGGTKKGA